jgi:hypothetical protein
MSGVQFAPTLRLPTIFCANLIYDLCDILRLSILVPADRASQNETLWNVPTRSSILTDVSTFQPPNAPSAALSAPAPASPQPTRKRHRNRQVTTPAADVDCQASGALRARNRGSWLSAFKSVVFKKKFKNTSIVRLLRRFGPDREVEHGLFPPRVQTKLWRSAHAYITEARVLVKRPRIWARNPVGLLLPGARRHA